MPFSTLNYTSIGEGPPLLFVNGIFQYRQAWQPVVNHLKDSYRCILFDFPNQNTGKNGNGLEPSFDHPDAYEDYILYLLDSLSLKPEETRVCALSWGACLIRTLHFQKHVHFKGLALIGLHCPELWEFYKLFHREFQTLLEDRGSEHFIATIFLWFFSSEWWATNAPIHEILKERFGTILHKEGLDALHRSAIADFERGYPEGRFSCPTTLISGEHDPLAPPKFVQRYAQAAGADFLQVHGGHMFAGENPELAATILRQVLGDDVRQVSDLAYSEV